MCSTLSLSAAPLRLSAELTATKQGVQRSANLKKLFAFAEQERKKEKHYNCQKSDVPETLFFRCVCAMNFDEADMNGRISIFHGMF
jgi:hypothetical protein